MHPTARKIWTSIMALALVTGCASLPKPNQLVAMEQWLNDPAQTQEAESGDADLFKQAQALFAKAQAAYNGGDETQTIHYATFAELSFKTAIERAKIAAAEAAKQSAEQRQSEAVALKAEQDERYQKFAKRVARMEKIQQLESTLASQEQQTAAEKKKLADELDRAKKEQKELLAQEKSQSGTQSQLAVVKAKIETAQSLEAQKYDAENVELAKANLLKAEKVPAEEAMKLIQEADTAITAAIAKAKEGFQQRDSELDVLTERKALFEDARKIGKRVKVSQEERGIVIMLHQLFKGRRAEVKENKEFLIKGVGELAKKYPNYQIMIEGHTDSRGKESKNQTVSTNQAQAVLDYLVLEQKLDINRIKSAGYGESKPIADNASPRGRKKNRRIQVVFLFR